MQRSFRILLSLAVLVSVFEADAIAQNRVRLPSTMTAPTYVPQTAQVSPSWTAPATAGTVPGVTLGAPQPFDPYGFPSSSPVVIPPGSVLGAPGAPPAYGAPSAVPPFLGGASPSSVPNFTVPPLTTPPYPTAAPRSLPATPAYPSPGLPGVQPPAVNPYPSATPWTPVPSGPAASYPPTLYSDGSVLPPATGGLPPPPLGGSVVAPSVQPAPVFPNGIPWVQQQNGNYQRLFEDTGALYSFVWGNPTTENPDRLSIHEVDLFTTAVFNNFGHSSDALRVTPGFTFDFLSGPAVPDKIVLPNALYAGYIDALWQPQLTPQFRADLNARIGVYSDFERYVSESLRVTGRGLGILQLTPTVAVKAGVEYINRARIKLFPALGVLWTPDPQTRWDIYFPRPEVSKYWRTIGTTNTDVWWHLGAEYGGGSWAVTRPAGAPMNPGDVDRVDINDVYLYTGFEWNRLNRMDGILDIGWVFAREIYVAPNSQDNLSLDDSFMIRAGIRF